MNKSAKLIRVFTSLCMLAMVFGISSCKDDDKEEEFFKSKNFNEALTGLWVSVQGNTYDYFLGTTAKRPEAYGQNVVVAYWNGKFYNCGRPTLTDVDGGMKINGGPEFFQNLVITEYSNSSKSFTVIDHSDDSVRTFVRMSTPELGAIKNVNHTGRSYYVEVQLFENDGSRNPLYTIAVGELGSGQSLTVPFWIPGTKVAARFYDPVDKNTLVDTESWTDLKPGTAYILNY